MPATTAVPIIPQGTLAYGLLLPVVAQTTLLAQPWESSAGTEEIRRVYQELLAGRPRFEPGEQREAMVNGDLALTSTCLVGGGATAEVARRQPDGTWLWAIDQPAVLG